MPTRRLGRARGSGLSACRCAARAAWLALVVLAGCAHARARQQANGPQALYQLAVEELAEGLVEEAVRDLEDLRARYPYAREAALGELRLADAQVKGGKAIEAIETYRGFLRAHPQHEQAAYALLQVAEQLAGQLPRDHWLLPPKHERDLAAVQEAADAYATFLERFPTSPSAPRARAGHRQCRERLAAHELYVARFYLRAGHWEPVCPRARAAAERFGELPLAAPAAELCRAAEQLHQRRGIGADDAQDAFPRDAWRPRGEQQIPHDHRSVYPPRP